MSLSMRNPLLLLGIGIILWPSIALGGEYRAFTLSNPAMRETRILKDGGAFTQTFTSINLPLSSPFSGTPTLGVLSQKRESLPVEYQGIPTPQKLKKQQEALQAFSQKAERLSRALLRDGTRSQKHIIQNERLLALLDILRYTLPISQRQSTLLDWRIEEFENQNMEFHAGKRKTQSSAQILMTLRGDIAELIEKTHERRAMLNERDLRLLKSYAALFTLIEEHTNM
ncbi:hypothetical protein A2635_01895 [Candidatus Peribacteria bacterium RIFCSPHIGHO2_01_FULL_51_9]|nr:MAG: hypothetical protein A2635_01895 [Candidatus Peribacteria bacterium RIFCSPHIGHO2_01_FULL_51_9]